MYRDVANEGLNDVIELVESIMQALITFEKQFNAHKDTETTH